MVGKVLEFTGRQPLEMNFVLAGFLCICSLVLQSQYLISVSRQKMDFVEAVAVLISKKPCMRPGVEAGKLGGCFKAKLNFIKDGFARKLKILS